MDRHSSREIGRFLPPAETKMSSGFIINDNHWKRAVFCRDFHTRKQEDNEGI